MDYDLRVSTLEEQKSNFAEIYSKAEELVTECNNLKIDGDIASLKSKVNEKAQKITSGYKNFKTWLDGYVDELKETENSLVSKVETPTLKGDFTNIFKKILVPALKTNASSDAKKAVKDLGNKGAYGDLDMTNYPRGDSYEDGLARAVLVAKYLVKYGGFTPVQAAALAGVYLDENNCDPGEVMQAEKDGYGVAGTGGNGYGAGIASWTFEDSKRQSLIDAGFDPNTPIESLTMQQQCDMIIAESQKSDSYYYDALKRCETLEDASATAVVMIGGPGYSSNWDTHPTPAEAKAMSDWYGRSNDANFGASSYHWDLDVRRLENAKEIYARM